MGKQKHRFLIAAAVALLALAAAQAHAQEYSGQETVTPTLPQIPGAAGITTVTKDLSIDLVMYFDLKWKVWTLLGEPVVDSTVAWSIDKAVVKSAGFLKVEKGVAGRVIPKEVAAKIRVYDLVFLVGLSYSGLGSSSCNLSIDPGALARPFVDAYGLSSATSSISSFRKLGAEARKGYYSFNVPGSPDWSKLFWSDDMINSYAADTARGIVLKGFKSIRPRIFSAKIDLGPVKDWLLTQERQAIDKAKADVAKREGVLAAKEAERKKTESKDFWNTPATADSTADVAERQAISQARTAVQAVETSYSIELGSLTAARDAVDASIASKKLALDSAPKPGEGLRGELVKAIVPPDGWKFAFPPKGNRAGIISAQGEFAVMDVVTGLREPKTITIAGYTPVDWQFTSVSFARNGRYVYIAGFYFTRKKDGWSDIHYRRILFDTLTGVNVFAGRVFDDFDPIISPDQATYLVNKRSSADLCDLKSGATLSSYKKDSNDDFFYSPDSRFVVSVHSTDGFYPKTSIYRLPDLALVAELEIEHWRYLRAIVTPQSDRIVMSGSKTDSKENGYMVLSFPDLRRLTVLEGKDTPAAWQILSDGKRLVGSNSRGEAAVFDLESGRELLRLQEEQKPVLVQPRDLAAAKVSKGDRYLALRVADETRIFDLQKGTPLVRVSGTQNEVVNWLDDGRSFILYDKEKKVSSLYR